MDFDKLFAFLSSDPNWHKKIGIAAVLILTQIGIVAVMGWAAEIAVRVGNDHPEPLPEWDDLGTFFITGLKLVGAALVWFLAPALLVVCQSTLVVFAVAGRESASLAPLLTTTSILVYLLVFIYLVAGMLMFSPLYVLAGEGTGFRELLRPAPAWRLLRANLSGYILTILVSALINVVLVGVGLLACFAGGFFGAALGFTVLGILIGQATGTARSNLNPLVGNLTKSG